MQITAGWAKGQKLATPSGLTTRPTTGKVRAALFNMLAPYVEGANFLDFFAGSGGVGLEALSRGAAGCVFVESAPEALRCIRTNVEELQRRASRQNLAPLLISIAAKDAAQAPRYIERHGPFDLIYLDPPYADAAAWLERLNPQLALLAAPEAILVMETASGFELPATMADETVWELLKQRTYGDTMIWLWQKNLESPSH